MYSLTIAMTNNKTFVLCRPVETDTPPKLPQYMLPPGMGQESWQTPEGPEKHYKRRMDVVESAEDLALLLGQAIQDLPSSKDAEEAGPSPLPPISWSVLHVSVHRFDSGYAVNLYPPANESIEVEYSDGGVQKKFRIKGASSPMMRGMATPRNFWAYTEVADVVKRVMHELVETPSS